VARRARGRARQQPAGLYRQRGALDAAVRGAVWQAITYKANFANVAAANGWTRRAEGLLGSGAGRRAQRTDQRRADGYRRPRGRAGDATIVNGRGGKAFGIDIGGSGMKAAPVDLGAGDLLAERYKIATPKSAKPAAMTDIVRQLVEHFEHKGRVGVTFPGVIRNGVACTAANLDKSWIGMDVDAMFTEATGCDVHVVNDADAAGLAEMRFGAGRDRRGVVLVFTFGTGIGSALFVDGTLVPNTEIGHIEVHGEDAERRAAASARDREGLSWERWAARVERYLHHVVRLFWPSLIIVGGGASRRADKWLPLIDVDCELVPAALTNEAGIVGAALVGAMDTAIT
jgi:polyphosphate glucokinase